MISDSGWLRNDDSNVAISEIGDYQLKYLSSRITSIVGLDTGHFCEIRPDTGPDLMSGTTLSMNVYDRDLEVEQGEGRLNFSATKAVFS